MAAISTRVRKSTGQPVSRRPQKTIERPLFNQTRAPKPLEVVADEPQGEPEEPQASADDFTLLGVGVTETGITAVLSFK